MKIRKVDIDFTYQPWGSWAIGFWLYTKWFGLQILMFKVIIQKHIEWNVDKIDQPIHMKESE